MMRKVYEVDLEGRVEYSGRNIPAVKLGRPTLIRHPVSRIALLEAAPKGANAYDLGEEIFEKPIGACDHPEHGYMASEFRSAQFYKARGLR